MSRFILVALLLACWISAATAGPADPLPQEALSAMDAIQLQTEFDSTIQLARQAQERFHKSRGRRLATAFIPLAGIAAGGETAARAGNLQSYRHKLLQLKRELRGRFPQAWEETKKKWLIDDNYQER